MGRQQAARRGNVGTKQKGKPRSIYGFDEEAEVGFVAVPTEVPTQAVPPTQELELHGMPAAVTTAYKKPKRSFMQMVELGMQLRQQKFTEELQTASLPDAQPDPPTQALADEDVVDEPTPKPKRLNQQEMVRVIPENPASPATIVQSQPYVHNASAEEVQHKEEAASADQLDAAAEAAPATPAAKKLPAKQGSSKRDAEEAKSQAPEAKKSRRLHGKQPFADPATARMFNFQYRHGLKVEGHIITATCQTAHGQHEKPTVVFGEPQMLADEQAVVRQQWRFKVIKMETEIRFGFVEMGRYSNIMKEFDTAGLSFCREVCGNDVAHFVCCYDEGAVVYNGNRSVGRFDEISLRPEDVVTVTRAGERWDFSINGGVAMSLATSTTSNFALQFHATSDAVEVLHAVTVRPTPVRSFQDADVQVTQSLVLSMPPASMEAVPAKDKADQTTPASAAPVATVSADASAGPPVPVARKLAAPASVATQQPQQRHAHADVAGGVSFPLAPALPPSLLPMAHELSGQSIEQVQAQHAQCASLLVTTSGILAKHFSAVNEIAMAVHSGGITPAMRLSALSTAEPQAPETNATTVPAGALA
mmetsp:Transcript_47446/g.112807  ORF Transcript_47446/g.112807 Transcript_47446/m.112807 type:complete len:590 (-) Transcript_47446:171-1940(-)